MTRGAAWGVPAAGAALGLLAALVLGGAWWPGAARAASPGSAERGEQLYARCIGCHSLDRDRTGPRHCGLLGRRAGSVSGFDYSVAMPASGITWTEATLDRFLADPTSVVPGTSMTFAGISDPGERRDLIAWLVVATADPDRCGALAP